MRGDEDAPVQENAAEPEQVTRGTRSQRDAVARRRYLWRGVLTGQLTAQENREFVWDVLFGDIGVMRPMKAATHDALVMQATLHNLGVKWLRDDVMPHRELYRQMTIEAEKRGDERRKERAAAVQQRATTDPRE